MTQYARPDNDKVDGNWENQAGSATNMYASINLASEDDSKYIKVDDNFGSTEVCEFYLDDIEDPGGAASSWASLPVLSMRTQELNGFGAVELTVVLFQGSSTIKTFDSFNPPDPAGNTDGSSPFILTATEADSLTATDGNFEDLFVRITSEDGFGTGATTRVYRLWIEFPDAAAPAAAAQNGSAFMLFLDT